MHLCRPSGVFGPVEAPPCVLHTFFPRIAALRHCSPLRFDFAWQRETLVEPKSTIVCLSFSISQYNTVFYAGHSMPLTQLLRVGLFGLPIYAEARTALALNGGRLDCSSGVPTIYVDITYPRYSMATFLKIQGVPLIQIQEGLFYELIDRGWYFPYTARYVFSR